ncbi:ORF6C domain-containing protein [Carnobacterium divergens]|uniref:ORF6C domain-containing protein n=1 Tax=Carnobacterium divergens TaxID=2748 RepID=UPI00288E5FF8|nr:ORF6C domain-containing protein [Carnobacterium divergens]MDT1997255.1 ORF6C domain-containing protein [Carnobacterium divergens]
MEELIKVTTNASGSQLASARDLYNGLEIKKRFSEWWISNSRGFVEGVDYTPYLEIHPQNKQEIQNYAMSLDMAKHLALQTGSSKGFEVRQYFIEVEKQYKQNALPTDPMEILSLVFKAQENSIQEVKAVKQDVGIINNRVTDIEENTPIHPSFLQEISKKRLARVTAFLGGKKSQAYKNRSFRDSVYAEAAKDFKDRFKVNKYSLTLSKDIPDALEYFETWMPKEETLEEIRRLNSQIELLEEN